MPRRAAQADDKVAASPRPLAALAAISVLAPLLLFGLGAWQSYRQHVEDAERTVRRTADVLQEHARRVFEIQQQVISRVDERIRGMAWDEIAASDDLHRFLRQIDDEVEQIDALWLIGPDAAGRNGSRFFPAPPAPHVSDRDYFIALKAADVGTFVGEPSPGRPAADRVYFSLARRRSSPGAAFDGMIVAALEPGYFATFYRSIATRPEDSVALVREDGTALARGPESLTRAVKLTPESGLMRAIRTGDRGHFRSVAQLDGVERLYGFRKVPGYPVLASYGLAWNGVVRAWYKDVALYGLVALGAMVALVAATATAARGARAERLAFERWRDSEARYGALFQQSPTGLLLAEVDPDDSVRYAEVNPALLSFLGRDAASIIGRTPEEAFPGDLGRVIGENYRKAIATREPVEYEAKGTGSRGPFIRRAIVVPLPDRDGRVTKVLGTSIDVTEERRLEDQVRQMQRMEAVGQLTGGIAHDFNNLLTIIAGGLQMFETVKDPERRQRYLDGMRQAAARGAALTRQLLAFSRRQRLEPEPIDLRRRIEGMHELLERSLREDIKITWTFAANLWPVNVDPGQLELAVLNVAVNARDAMPAGGTITIHGENAPALRDGDLSGDFVRLSVTDTGVGMAPDVLARVFEPFFTTKEVGKGTGLGLSQVYGFARQSGGAVRIESVEGQGTTVSLLLPRSVEAFLPSPAPELARDAGTAASPRACVLLVEDNDEVAALANDMLRVLGHDVIHASSAAAALGALADARRIDLVFSDVMMPVMDGIALAHEIRARRPDLPILLTTGYPDARHGDLPEGVRLLAKPYRLETLSAAIASTMTEVRYRNPAHAARS